MHYLCFHQKKEIRVAEGIQTCCTEVLGGTEGIRTPDLLRDRQAY